MTFGQLMAGEILPAPAAINSPVPSFSPIDTQAVFNDFANRLRNLETAIKLQVPNDRIISMIALTTDTALISSDKIALVGEVTFFDWVRDVNGAATGVIDPSITQIRGGVIRTGQVASLDGNSWIDLDAAGTTPFIKCQSAVSILANGNFSFGSGTSVLTWNGSALSVGSATLLAGTAASTVVTNASTGAAEAGAYALAASKLAASSSYTLTGVAQISGTGGVMAGSVTWNSSTGAVTGGSGVVLTQNGITGVKAGVVQFSIDTSGNAAFGGVVSTTNYIVATGYNAITGGFAAIAGIPSVTGYIGVYGESGTGYGVWGNATANGGYGVRGDSTGSGGLGVFGSADTGSGVGGTTSGSGIGVTGSAGTAGIGVKAWNTGSGTALAIVGKMTMTDTTTVTNLSAELWGPIKYTGAGLSGAQTPTLGSAKPGTTGGAPSGWISVAYGATTFYMPYWAA